MKKMMLLLFPYLVFAHGENIFGPHHGYIRMPGTFHTELLVNSDMSVSIYLMDVNNKNPITENSSIELSLKNAKNTISIPCIAMKEAMHFHCKSKDNIDLSSGKLEVIANRSSVQGKPVNYELPLKLEKTKSMHH